MIRNLVNRIFYFDLDCYLVFQSSSCIGQEYQQFDGYDIKIVDHKTDLPELEAFYLSERWSGDKNSLQDHLNGRFVNGSYCIVSMARGEIVGAAWLCRIPNNGAPNFSGCISNDVGSYLCFDSYVNRAHRGHQLQRRMDNFRKRMAFDKGATNVYTFVGCRNFASIRSMLSVNEKYKITYHVMIKLGKLLVFNFYPKWKREVWHNIND